MEEMIAAASYSITTTLWAINGVMMAFLISMLYLTRELRKVIEKE